MVSTGNCPRETVFNTILGKTIFLLAMHKFSLMPICLNIFNKMLFCCKLRPIVFNFPFRRNQFLPERHFSGSHANLSELIFDFLDPFLPLVGFCVLLSFRKVLSEKKCWFYGIQSHTRDDFMAHNLIQVMS